MAMANSRQLLSTKKVCSLVGVSRMTLWNWERQGRFPQRVQVGPNKVAWLKHEIDSWIDKKAVERDGKRQRVRL